MIHKRLLLLLLLAWGLTAAAQVGDLPRSTAAEQGVDPQAIVNFLDAIGSIDTELHHVMIARHGKVIAEMHAAPFAAADAQTLYSESKTFASMAVGIAIGENRLRLTDRMAAFFPEKLPATISPEMAQITVRDLLVMASGIKPDWDMRRMSSDWLTDWFAKPVTTAPGTKFQYDSMCTFLLSAIVQRVTGKTLLQYLDEKVFAPLHITQANWELSPDGICTGGWGLRLQAESQLKMGLLMLNRGNWNGRQLIPAEWIDEAIEPHINYEWYKPTDAPTNKNQGYGYQLWRCKWPGAFRADGAYGQFIVCVPDADLVVVINQVSEKCYDVLDCVWDKLMPGMHDAPLKADKKAQQLLVLKCSTFSLKPQAVTQRSRTALPLSIMLEENKHGITGITVDNDRHIIISYADAPQETFTYGNLSSGKNKAQAAQWPRTVLAGVPPYSIMPLQGVKGLEHDFEAAAMFGWNADGRPVIDIYYVNWITTTSFVINPDNHTITIKDNYNDVEPETVAFTVVK